MHLPTCFMLAFAAVSLGISDAYAQHEQLQITPYRPVLRQSTDADLCGAFASAWGRVFRGKTALGEQWLDLKAAYPDAEVLTFPPQRAAPDRFGGLYDESFHQSLDVDNDGTREVLHIEANQVGWRYLGADIYLFDSEAAYLEAKTAYEKRQPGGKLFVSRPRDSSAQPLQPLVLHPPSDVVYVFSHNGAFYTTAAPTRSPRVANLIRIRNVSDSEVVCSLELLPSVESFDSFTTSSRFYQALTSIYGGPQGCLGTMGWTAPPPRRHLLTLFHRPQVIGPEADRSASDLRREDAAREIRLLTWGLSDPTSWSVYRRLKSGQEEFVGQMRAYYRRNFAKSDSQARTLAEQSYRFLVDQIVYARAPDSHSLTRVAQETNSQIEVSAESSPEAIATAAIGSWLKINAGLKSKNNFTSLTIWRDAVLAAIYTRQSPTLVGELWARMDEVHRTLEAKSQNDDRKTQLASTRTTHLNEMLLAALGNSTLVPLTLSLGAEAEVPTNWFKKTPLMYAAQIDDLVATQLLLARGADPSAQTSASDTPCGTLKRDARTPLMYAAENASPELIEVLLDAGADVAMTDSQGNTALWYLERNHRLSESEKALLRRRLNPIQ